MRITKLHICAIAAFASTSFALSVSNNDRRAFLKQGLATTIGTTAGILSGVVTSNAAAANAAIYADYSDYIKTDSGLRYKVTKEGTGGKPLSVHNATGFTDMCLAEITSSITGLIMSTFIT